MLIDQAMPYQLVFLLVALIVNLLPKPALLPVAARGRSTPFDRLVRVRFDLSERIIHFGRIVLILNLILATELILIDWMKLIVPGLDAWNPSNTFMTIGYTIYVLIRLEWRGRLGHKLN